MATISGKSKASCSAANAALPSANTRQRPWRRCRRIAPRRTSSSPARHLTPALPTVPPVLPKTLLTLNFTTHTHDWRTHRDTCFHPPWTIQWTCTISPLPIKTTDHQLCHTGPGLQSNPQKNTLLVTWTAGLYISYISLLGRRTVHFVLFFKDWLILLNGFSWRVMIKEFWGWGRGYRCLLQRQPQHTAGFNVFDLCGHLSSTIPAKLADKYWIMLPLCVISSLLQCLSKRVWHLPP